MRTGEERRWAARHAAILLCMMICASGATDSKPHKETVEEAITLSGQRVTLYKDGSWEYKKAKDPNEIVFRNIPWGATADEAKRLMKDTPLFDTDILIAFADTVDNLKAHCVLGLAGGRFVRGQYQFAETHANDNLFLSDFDRIDTLLAKKYGKPSRSGRTWRDNIYRDDPNNWGMAVKTGRLTVYSEWRAGQVTVTHGLRGDNFKVDHGIEYRRDDMEILERSIQEQEDQKKL
jgi:hypothetical protein